MLLRLLPEGSEAPPTVFFVLDDGMTQRLTTHHPSDVSACLPKTTTIATEDQL
jgi:hypothetical protein